MPEIVGNLHLHTTSSDGTGTHEEVANAAARAGLDFIIYTDHNCWIDGIEGWYQPSDSQRKILRLVGQEVNDMALEPELNHMLCYFVQKDLQPAAADPQKLIDTVLDEGGLCFLAHPLERPGYGAATQTYPWISWDISGFTGIELWNAMTDVKWQFRTMPRGFFGAYLSRTALSAPFPELLAKWDSLLAAGQKVVAIGSSDAHAMTFSVGPFIKTIFPYEFLFRAVNTHLLLANDLAYEVKQAKAQIYQALKAGHCFVSYDLIGSSKGFTFTANSGGQWAIMGDTLLLEDQDKVTFRIDSPQAAKLRLLKDGRVITQANARQLRWQTDEPGIYRVEAYRHFWGQLRGWVFTNPIYVQSPD